MSYHGYQKTGLYRSRDGVIAGVCAGIAEYFDMSVFWTRALTVLMVLCTGLWPGAFAYFVAALVMKKDPYIRWE